MKKVIQISAGSGPVECDYVVAQVLKILLDECREKVISFEVVSRVEGTENGTLRSATIALEGAGVKMFLKTWLGSILWIEDSQFRKNHKRKNWYVEVFLLKDEVVKPLDLKEVKFQTMRSQGAGGQHVNKVSSAVRATHMESKVSVTVMDTRSQHRNKKIAIERLTEKYYNFQLEKIKENTQKTWENHGLLKRGNPVRIFKINKKKKEYKKAYKDTRKKLKTDLKSQMNK